MRRIERKAADYWSIVFRQFRKRRLAVGAYWLVLLLFTVAMLAPFLASSRPLILGTEDGLAFPVAGGLTREDFTWLAGALAAVVGRLTYAVRRRRDPERAQLLPSVLVAIGLFVASALAARALVPHVADRVDWAAAMEAARSEGRTLVRTPVPFGPYDGSLLTRLKPPGWNGHALGTDNVGRDVMARMVWGTRVSLIVGFVAVGIYVMIGMAVGALAGYFGGGVDVVMSRLIEVMMCFPVFFLILAVLAFRPPSIFNIMVLIGVTGWTGVARLVRGEVLRLRHLDFVSAGVALGASPARMIVRHVMPNALAPVLVSATFGVAGAILVEASLSFLGFGVPPPTASWGSILFDARPYISTHPWLPLYPGLAIFVTVTAYNLVGEGLRDAMDPRLVR